MIHELLLTRMKIQVDFFTDHVKFYAAAHSLPSEMKVWILICSFFPKLWPFFQSWFNQSRIISLEDGKS
jgi:hypothetical protein